ncbi:hypothetical protein J3A83DRAFT_4184485 [Scleroderma citrinum]
MPHPLLYLQLQSGEKDGPNCLLIVAQSTSKMQFGWTILSSFVLIVMRCKTKSLCKGKGTNMISHITWLFLSEVWMVWRMSLWSKLNDAPLAIIHLYLTGLDPIGPLQSLSLIAAQFQELLCMKKKWPASQNNSGTHSEETRGDLFIGRKDHINYCTVKVEQFFDILLSGGIANLLPKLVIVLLTCGWLFKYTELFQGLSSALHKFQITDCIAFGTPCFMPSLALIFLMVLCWSKLIQLINFTLSLLYALQTNPELGSHTNTIYQASAKLTSGATSTSGGMFIDVHLVKTYPLHAWSVAPCGLEERWPLWMEAGLWNRWFSIKKFLSSPNIVDVSTQGSPFDALMTWFWKLDFKPISHSCCVAWSVITPSPLQFAVISTSAGAFHSTHFEPISYSCVLHVMWLGLSSYPLTPAAPALAP